MRRRSLFGPKGRTRECGVLFVYVLLWVLCLFCFFFVFFVFFGGEGEVCVCVCVLFGGASAKQESNLRR